MLYYFFFFQAEDGIRDRTVTGVQTCALPICPRSDLMISERGPARYAGRVPRCRRCFSLERSEERRVGKECRCRWRTCECRKKTWKRVCEAGRAESVMSRSGSVARVCILPAGV